MNVTATVKNIGVNDYDIDLFENQFPVSHGMSYNSYLILDEKKMVVDSVEISFRDQWFAAIEEVLGQEAPDYLLVLHMEPDHSANIAAFMEKYPEATIVSSAKAFGIMKNFFGTDYSQRRIVIADQDTLNLGNRTLTFYSAPMVHWPEVMLAYDDQDQILFSADAFGKFGTRDWEDDWFTEARRYYFCIISKFNAQMQATLKKTEALEIKRICSLHGPVLDQNIEQYMDAYKKWSSYTPEKEGTVIAYASFYGNTERAVSELKKVLCENGKEVVMHNLARCEMSAAVADAFCYNNLVLASPTYNGDVFPQMRTFLEHLTTRGFCNRRVAMIENGSWAPTAMRTMKQMMEACPQISYTDTEIKILSAMSDDNQKELEQLSLELV